MSQDSLLGSMFDEYRIDKPLGQGGMARVYRALDTKLRRYVALKVIAPRFRADDEYAIRFQREAQSIARLEHPNIVSIYRFGEVNGMYYIAMQYIEGTDVAYLIKDYRKTQEIMPIPDIVGIVKDVAVALDYMHKKGVIHRDIKPSNIMVTNEGRALVTDFGLVLLNDEGTHGKSFGSPYYIAPEQAVSSASVVPQSDLYSLGVTLFELITGDVPFKSQNPMEVALRHLSDEPPSPSRLNKTIPSTLDNVILRTLAKAPADRYQSGAQLSTAFAKAAKLWQGSPVLRGRNVSRPSNVMISQKVKQSIAASPLPPLPPISGAIQIDRAPTQHNSRKVLWELTAIAVFITALIALVFSQSSQSTVLNPEGRKFVIFYDENMLYMANQSSENVPITNVTFERILTNGLTAERFEGSQWATYYGLHEARKCMILRVVGKKATYPRQDCPSGINAELNAITKERFWTAKEGSVEFRVLWLKQEVARCQIASQRCEIWLPKK